MKSKNPITKKVTTFLLCAALSAAAVLILSCAPLLEPSVPAPAGTSGETGRVVLSVSSGATGGARTILPTATPAFSRYKLVFSKSGESNIEIDPATGLAGSGVSQELAAGTWTATVTAYRKFTVSGGTETEYQAAVGSTDITVSAGQITNVTVNLAPLPVDTTEPGIFTYTVSFPTGASATLTLGADAPVTLTVPGTEFSVAKVPGYYDLFISAEKGALRAGLSEKVHIYAGLESKGEFTFTDADFTATVYLAGTVSLPGGLTWSGINSGTVNVYSDAARTTPIETVSLTGLSWVAGISASHIGSTVYLGAALTGTDGKIYTGTETAAVTVTEAGVRNITLADTTSPANVSGLTGASGPGDGQVTLTWTDPVDADLDHVEITWAPGGTSPVSVLKGTQTQTISGLTNGTSYTFTVKAVDTAGNESGDETATATPFVPVTDITGLPATGTVGDITLSGTVEPSSATYKTIVWSVKEAETTAAGAEINNGVLSTTGAGSVKVIATITDGTAVGTPYIKEFSITIIINPPSSGDQMTGTISGVSVSFRYVPAGSFQRDNTAANVTTITKGYWMGETEVTQELFLKVMGVNPSEFNGSTGKEPDSGETQTQRPVENVSWYDAIAFCNKLSLLDGRNPVYSVTVSGSEVDWAALAYNDIPSDINVDWNAVTMDTGKNGYRLPTEMEWMWAAIGADTAAPGQLNITGYDKAFAGSDGFNNVDDYAWYDDNSNSKTHEVGKKAANELGLKDMSGNVVEWCWDRYGDYPDEIQTDPQGASSGTNRVIRGGGRYSVAADVRSATRYDYTPSNRYANVGFRLVRPQF